MNSTPTTEDRIWAVLSHLSALAFGMGIALPILGWADQRNKSSYASFQSLQALGYQSLGFTVWILSYLVILIVAVMVLLFSPALSREMNNTREVLLQPGVIFFLIILFGLFGLYFVLPIIGSVACALGREFRYPILGYRLARYLGYDSAQESKEQTILNEDREFRWLAAMGHFSILILLWGLLAPLTTWILYEKRSLFLRFQSIQTLAFQAVTTVLFFVGLFLYLFGFLLLVAVMAGIGEADLNSPLGIASIGVFGFSLLISFVLILLVPLLHIMGQWAGYRVLKGDDYRYPLLAGFVERWIRHRSALIINRTLDPKEKSA